MPLTHMDIHSGRSFIGACITDQQNFHVVLELKPAVQAVITNGLRNIVVNCFHLLHDGIEWDLREVLSSLLSLHSLVSPPSSFTPRSSTDVLMFDVLPKPPPRETGFTRIFTPFEQLKYSYWLSLCVNPHVPLKHQEWHRAWLSPLGSGRLGSLMNMKVWGRYFGAPFGVYFCLYYSEY